MAHQFAPLSSSLEAPQIGTDGYYNYLTSAVQGYQPEVYLGRYFTDADGFPDDGDLPGYTVIVSNNWVNHLIDVGEGNVGHLTGAYLRGIGVSAQVGFRIWNGQSGTGHPKVFHIGDNPTLTPAGGLTQRALIGRQSFIMAEIFFNRYCFLQAAMSGSDSLTVVYSAHRYVPADGSSQPEIVTTTTVSDEHAPSTYIPPTRRFWQRKQR